MLATWTVPCGFAETLGFRLTERHGNHWASLDGGPGLTIGLHPSTAEIPAGRQGSIALGVYLDRPIQETVSEPSGRGVRFSGPIINDKALSLAFFADPDGNPLYVAEMKQVYR
jgi:hypothetical protein